MIFYHELSLAGSFPHTLGANYRRVLNIALVLAILTAFLSLRTDDGPEAGEKAVQGNYDVRLAKEKAERFDRKYISRLISQAGKPGSAHSALRGGEQAAAHNYTQTIVVGRMKDEPEKVQWIYDKLLHMPDPQIYVVDDPDTDGPHLKVNHGREAAVYMNYIIDHYDNLNDITFFWHADETVWHNNMLLEWDSVETINRMDREHIMRSGYTPSRCDHWPGCPDWLKFEASRAEHQIDPHRLQDMFNTELFRRFFPDVQEFPPYFAGTCCSQFAATRDAIRGRPIEVYQRFLEWILEYEWDFRSGVVFEYTWPYLFLGRGKLCPSMEECYCKTYNFCMEDPKDVEDMEIWNGLRSRREEVQWQVNFAESTMKSKLFEFRDQGTAPEKLLELEYAFQAEIDRLRLDLERLVNSTWLKREDIIHHWKLAPPPTGW